MDQKLLAQIDAFIEANRDAIIEDIRALVAIDSVQTAPQPGAPCGPGAQAARDNTLEIAARLGFETKNCEDSIG
ncbi:MAG: dipeptidase, partial [Faecalibacterium sp.]|nr:dipeptidase [Faecalibacterium sp.]